MTETAAPRGPRALQFAGFPTREEWLDFVMDSAPVRPVLPTAAKLRGLTEGDRRELDRQRRLYHLALGESVVFDPPAYQTMRRDLDEIIQANMFARSARRAYAVSGESMMGKTTFLETYGKRQELAIRRAHPGGRTASDDDLVPVVYTTLSAGATTKTVNRFMAEFYGLPTSGTADELTLRIQRVSRRCGTLLILVDDIHHLDTLYKDRDVAVDHFKMLLSTIPATFVFAGVDIEHGALLGGARGASSRAVAKRTTVATLEPYKTKRKEQATEWCGLLEALAQHVVLVNHVPGDLSTTVDPKAGEPMFQYLFDRTAGDLGVLVDLVKRAANRAIADSSERITRPLLETVQVSRPKPKST